MRIDHLFQQAVTLIGAGDVPAPDRPLAEHPEGVERAGMIPRLEAMAGRIEPAAT